MFALIARRLLWMVPTLFIISLVSFALIQLPPGDYLTSYIAEIRAQGENVTVDKIAFLREQYGLDKPLWE